MLIVFQYHRVVLKDCVVGLGSRVQGCHCQTRWEVLNKLPFGNEVVLVVRSLSLSFRKFVVQKVRLFLLFAFLIPWLLIIFVPRVFGQQFRFVPLTGNPILVFGLRVVLLKLVLLFLGFNRVLPKSGHRHFVVLAEI